VGAPNGSAQLALSQLGHDGILGAMSDGSGVVALIERSGSNIPTQTSLWLYDQSGAQLGSYQGADTQVTEQLTGFMVSDRSEDLDGRGKVSAVDEHGNVTASTGLVHRTFNIAPYALGGVIAVGSDSGGSPATVTWFDESVRSRWQTSLPTSQRVVGMGVDREGNTLVMLERAPPQSGNFDGIWIDRDGNVGSVFDAGNYPGGFVLSPRVGNGMFLGIPYGNWVVQFDPFGGPTPAPDWLSSRPAGTRLHMARNGRAYAVIPSGVNAMGACSTTIDIVAPSGKSCGTAEFPSPPTDSGVCQSVMWVGYDGTAIQEIASTPVAPGFNGVMSRFRWWTAYFH
jgi:hypothetical protein